MASSAWMEVISLWSCSGVLEAQVALIAAFGSSVLAGLVSCVFLLCEVSLMASRAQGQPVLKPGRCGQLPSPAGD